MRSRYTRKYLVPAFMVIVAACAPDADELSTAPDLQSGLNANHTGGPLFSEWSAPVNVGPPVNSAGVEQGPAISKDGLSLYFHCADCPGGFGDRDLWVSRRASVDAAWGVPQNLGPNINTSYAEVAANLSTDGRWLFFASDRPGGLGDNDLYVARRRDKEDDLGWLPPVHLGSINSIFNEGGPQPFDDPETGVTLLYFASNRSGNNDIYVSTWQPDGTFGPPQPVAELNTSFNEGSISIRADGLELILVSNHTGTHGAQDVWVSTRARISDPWSPPVNLGAPINSSSIDGGAELSFDGTVLYFHTPNRPENVGGPFFDIWYATRTKLQ